MREEQKKTTRKRKTMAKGTDVLTQVRKIRRDAKRFKNQSTTFIAFTDGKCNWLNPNREGAASYIVINAYRRVRSCNAKAFLHTTSNRMAILSVFSAVMSCPESSYIHVFTESTYAISVLRDGFKNDLFTPNMDIIGKYLQMKGDRKVFLHKVEEIYRLNYNEECEKLTNEALESMTTSLVS